MFKPAADAWALEVARQVVDREAFETTHVELKAEVPDPRKFARQFAGLANAARWHPILVLLGLDQQRGLVGVERFEVGDWYQSLRSSFEYGEGPALVFQNFLTFNHKDLAAFVFETDNPPYVLGASKQGGEREVPWRYGSNTGVAGRRELLTMLLRRTSDPEVEFVKAELRLSRNGALTARAEIFIYPASTDEELAIPLHRISVQVVDPHGAVQELPNDVSLRPLSESSRAKVVDAAVVIPAVSKLQLIARSEPPVAIAGDASQLDLSFSVRPARTSTPIRFTVTVARRDHPDGQSYWELAEHHKLRLHTNADALRELEEMAQRFPPRRNWNPLGTLPGPL
jgi:hypothetical protein